MVKKGRKGGFAGVKDVKRRLFAMKLDQRNGVIYSSALYLHKSDMCLFKSAVVCADTKYRVKIIQ